MSDNLVVASSHGSAGLLGVSSEQKTALLVEWREALVKIVEDDPMAVETRKTIAAIDEQLAALHVI